MTFNTKWISLSAIVILIVVGGVLVWWFWSSPQAVLNAEEQECLSRGGEMVNERIGNGKWCLIKYPDGGKTCKSSSECIGGCYVEDKTSSYGICSASNNAIGTCRARIEDKEQGILCID